MKKLPTQVPTQDSYTREFSKDLNPAQPSPTQPTQPSSLFSRTLFFFGYGAFLAFSTASGRWGTAQEREARGVARFRANGAKTCIFVFFKHFSELARAASVREPIWPCRYGNPVSCICAVDSGFFLNDLKAFPRFRPNCSLGRCRNS